MSLTRRQFLLGAGGLAAAATLAACGTNTGRTAPTSSGSTRSGATTTLSQWYHEYGEAGVKAAVEKFAQAYGPAEVKVKWNIGEYDKLLGAALLTDQGPDIFEVGNGASLDMIKAGQVVDLTDIVAGAVNQFHPAVMKRFTYQGKIYAIPQVVDMQLLYYRKSLLEKAGAKPPTRFEALQAAAVALSKDKKIGGFFAGNDGGLGVLGSVVMWASGFEQINADGTDIGFNDPAFFAALNSYRDFAKSGGLLDSASKDWYDGAAFVNGETAMQWAGLWSMTDILAAHKDDVGVVAFPAIGTKGRAVVPFGAFGCCVSAKSTNVDAAKAFAKWLWIEQEDKQVEFANNYGTHIPAKPALVSKCSKLADGPGAAAAQLLSSNGFTTDIRWTAAISEAYTAALTNVIKKGADAGTEIAKVSAVAKADLKRLGA